MNKPKRKKKEKKKKFTFTDQLEVTDPSNTPYFSFLYNL